MMNGVRAAGRRPVAPGFRPIVFAVHLVSRGTTRGEVTGTG